MNKNKGTIYYAAYDITENKIREKVIIVLEKYGMDRIQKSLFCGSLNSQRLKDLTEELKRIINNKNSLYLIPTTKKLADAVIMLGRGFDKEYTYDRKAGDVI